MGYSDGEISLLDIIQLMDDYNEQNSDRANWGILDSGKSASYVVVRPGVWDNTQTGLSANERTWLSVIEVWRPYRGPERAYDIELDVEKVLEQIEQYPTLNGTSGVYDAMITGGGELLEVTRSNGSLWLKWEIFCEWKEEKEVVNSE